MSDNSQEVKFFSSFELLTAILHSVIEQAVLFSGGVLGIHKSLSGINFKNQKTF